MYSFPDLEPVCYSMSSSNCCFLTIYRFLRRQVRWAGIPISWRIFHSLLTVRHGLSQFVDSVTWAGSKWLAPIQRWNEISSKVKCLSERYTSSKPWSQRKIQVCCCSVAQSCPTLCNPMNSSMPHFLSFTISQSLLKLMPIESVMPSNHLILCRPLLLLSSIFPSVRVFSNELAHHIRLPKYWSFNFSISPSNEYSGLISFRMDWFDLLAVQGLSRVFSSTTIGKHQFFGTQPSLMVHLSCPYRHWTIQIIVRLLEKP